MNKFLKISKGLFFVLVGTSFLDCAITGGSALSCQSPNGSLAISCEGIRDDGGWHCHVQDGTISPGTSCQDIAVSSEFCTQYTKDQVAQTYVWDNVPNPSKVFVEAIPGQCNIHMEWQ